MRAPGLAPEERRIREAVFGALDSATRCGDHPEASEAYEWAQELVEHVAALEQQDPQALTHHIREWRRIRAAEESSPLREEVPIQQVLTYPDHFKENRHG